jgi:hypothetical protein
MSSWLVQGLNLNYSYCQNDIINNFSIPLTNYQMCSYCQYALIHFVFLQISLSFQIVHYNTLLAEIRTSLLDLQRGIKGLVVMSFELEHIFLCIYEGRVPAAWLKGRYPEAIL